LTDIERAGLGKRSGDVSYGRGLEGVSRARLDDRNDHSDSPISGGDDVFQRKCVAEEVVGQVKVKCSRVSGGSRPSNSCWALGTNLGRRLVELQGRDDGEDEEECAELVEHCKRWVVRGREEEVVKSDGWDDDTVLTRC